MEFSYQLSFCVTVKHISASDGFSKIDKKLVWQLFCKTIAPTWSIQEFQKKSERVGKLLQPTCYGISMICSLSLETLLMYIPCIDSSPPHQYEELPSTGAAALLPPPATHVLNTRGKYWVY